MFWLCAAVSYSAEPSLREAGNSDEAARLERSGDWPGAGYHWEQAMSAAEWAGDYDRAITNGERALAAWSHGSDPASVERQAFSLGVMGKLDIHQGRLMRGRERNLAALRLIEGRILAESGWRPILGTKPSGGIPPDLLEAWARCHRDTADWLDAQGRTVEAVELLTAAEASMAAVAAGGRAVGLYHRKLISSRAGMLKFLGFQKRAIGDYQKLFETRQAENASIEFPQRLNLAYYSAQFYGPRPEYLESVRKILRELKAAGRDDREARRLVAKMAYAYQKDGADVQDLEAVIAEARAAGAELDAIYAERDLAVLKADAGHREGVEAALLKSLEGVRRRGVKRGEPTLYREYGEFLVKDGRPGEGLRMLREAVRLTRGFGWTQHLPQLLASVAAAQGLIGDSAGLARTLSELDTLVRGGALIPEREFIAHCARARALLLLGRKDEAAAAITKAIAVADQAGLNDYQRFALAWGKDVKPVAQANTRPRNDVGSAPVDLQPVAVIANGEAGGIALTRFRLSNPGVEAAAGTLQIEGREMKLRFDEGSGVATVIASGAPGGAPGRLPLQIGAGEEILIKIEAAIGDAHSGLRLQWQGEAQTANAVCHLRSGSTNADDEAGATVTNTSLAWSNPFYGVAFHHPFRTVGGPQSFRIQPSKGCRVEVFDAVSGALLAVDANGDGEFRSAGDSLAGDANGDAFPDLPADATSGRGEIEILIFPLPGTAPAPADLRIEVQLQTTTGWKAFARDVLKPPHRSE